jgi:drug/metabolite transporter (DMT)-like permease
VHEQRGPDLVLLAVAVAAVSTSAPLVREAAAPSLLLACWRTALAAGTLAPFARHRPTAGERRRIALAGAFLAAHFATWISSLSYTSVSSSVALVATQPVWAALLNRRTVDRRAWLGIGVALVGAVAITGVDVSISARALGGDVLALLGGILAAAYVHVGADVRRTVPNSTYATGCYGTAAVLLLVAGLATGTPMLPHGVTWWWIVAITVGPQLLGHTVINAVLQRLGAVLVSVSILFEILGASLLAWWWFGEAPPAGTYPAAVLLVVGLLLVMRRPQPPAVD